MTDESQAGTIRRLRLRLDREKRARLEAERIAEVATRNALVDPLTGLSNRAMFTSVLETALARAHRAKRSIALLYLDLDGFKATNDTFGHDVGDQVLREAADRIRSSIRATDAAARLGGDEFAIICEAIDAADTPHLIARRVIEACNWPARFANAEVHISPSIGITLASSPCDPKTLIREADAAMYESKRRGGNRYTTFDESMRIELTQRTALERSLVRGLDTQQFFVAFQPTINVDSGRVACVEALARWRCPDYGSVPPDQFIGIAEESNQVVRLGEEISRQALEKYARWLEQMASNSRNDLPTLSLNASPTELMTRNFASRLLDRVSAAALSPDQISVEITESILVADDSLVESNLNQLTANGIRLDIDDFGTGYSSFSYLKRFEVDRLKIDRTFVKDLPEDRESLAIVDAILHMTRALDIEVIAEGVETLEQVELLAERGCRLLQGYLFGAPGPISRLRSAYDELPRHDSTNASTDSFTI